MRRILFGVLMCFVLIAPLAYAEDPGDIKLVEPRITGGKPLMDTLRERKSTRIFVSRELTPQMLSDLLWAAYGINRPKEGMRTAPSSKNSQEISIYVALKSGLYTYNAKDHKLDLVIAKNIQNIMGLQPFNGVAPIELIYVLDYSRVQSRDQRALKVGSVSAGAICQNVYLFCASEGLSTVVRAMLDLQKMHAAMGLREDQEILVAQTVGFIK